MSDPVALTAVLHPMTWIHLAVALTELMRAPFSAAATLLLVQRLVQDTYTHPIVYSTAAMYTSVLYTAFGEKMDATPIPIPRKHWGRALRLVGWMVADVVWTPLLGVVPMMVLLRLVDLIWVTGAWNRRLARTKLLVHVPSYAILIVGQLSVDPQAHIAVRRALFATFLALMGIFAGIAWIKDSKQWLAPQPTVREATQIPKGKSPNGKGKGKNPKAKSKK